ncbi:Hypothetical Protein FCC1311_004132 [Hondaea fermentalgiana]|uniref:Uncharacterized protein n=1 Tax=Hondaea fermentalgiana TaxID=2315210 RepID=A0A2R5G0Z4_9STRA|nr:Hypothetical Protein FCC1311_004132 [Hondaea fermentalgiana]|eukprot:GBG24195.1 Hypothetical Protein FCC1311_004132 [Hondaea fermentalgiana]
MAEGELPAGFFDAGVDRLVEEKDGVEERKTADEDAPAAKKQRIGEDEKKEKEEKSSAAENGAAPANKDEDDDDEAMAEIMALEASVPEQATTEVVKGEAAEVSEAQSAAAAAAAAAAANDDDDAATSSVSDDDDDDGDDDMMDADELVSGSGSADDDDDDDAEEGDSYEVDGGDEATETEKQLEYANVVIRIAERRLKRGGSGSAGDKMQVGDAKSNKGSSVLKSLLDAKQKRKTETDSSLFFDNPWE